MNGLITADLVENLNTLRIYPVQLAVELETGSRLPTGEYTPVDTIHFDSISTFSFHFLYQIRRQLSRARCEFNTRRRRDSTRQLRRVGVARYVLGLTESLKIDAGRDMSNCTLITLSRHRI